MIVYFPIKILFLIITIKMSSIYLFMSLILYVVNVNQYFQLIIHTG